MIKNYLKISFRNLIRYKAYSFINILGLSTGIACCLLIFLFIQQETSYDRFHKKADRIYRINSFINFGGSELDIPFSSDMMGETLKKDYPQVEEYTRIYNSNGSKLLKKGNEFIVENNVAHADSTFFNVFSFKPISGDLKSALNEPNTVVITESAAKKYFGTTDALGKFLETDNKQNYKVTAVIVDMPVNSHFIFDFLFSMDNVQYQWGNYLSHNFHTYLLLKNGTDYKEFEKNFRQFLVKYVFPQAQLITQISSIEDFENAGNKIKYTLSPLTDIHLYSARSFELSPAGNIDYIYIFSAVALFILLIACINFMNLTTARSANRAKEVGIRKTLGTGQRNLIWQFLSESTLLVVLSLLIALVIVDSVLPEFNNIIGKKLVFTSLLSPQVLPFLLLFPFIIGIIAGSYPAFYLSRFKPVQVLKGKFAAGSKNGSLRSILVVVQFSTSVTIIIATIIIYSQLNYIQNKNLGFHKEQVLTITGLNPVNAASFKNKMLSSPGVISGTLSGYLPVPSARSDNSFSKDAVMNATNSFNMQNWQVDYDYIKTMGMKIIRGRGFSSEFGSDSSAIIINEQAAKLLGYDDPVGQKVYTITNVQNKTLLSYTIIGVVKNFHYESLKQNIGPLSLILGNSGWASSFRVKAADINGIISSAKNAFKEIYPGVPFNYSFLDDSFNAMYGAEQRIGKIALIFAFFSVLIASLGLFGLATFLAEQRTKEIGIRKVLGANTKDIIMLLSQNFLKLVLTAFIIAAPFAWYFMNNWLEDFAYHVSITWWMVVSAGIILLVVTLFTTGYQAIKAAAANPVKSLKYE